MTTKSQPRNNADTRLSHNAEKATEAHDELDGLLSEATDEKFTGGISIWVGSQAGRLGTSKTERTKHFK